MAITTDGNAIIVSSSGRKSSIKDPSATLDFSFNWADWLAEIGDNIAAVTVTIDDLGAATPLIAVNTSYFNGIVTIFVSGGTLNKSHDLKCRITTSSVPPRSDERTLTIKIRDR